MTRKFLALVVMSCSGITHAEMPIVGNPSFEQGNYPTIVPPGAPHNATTIPGPGSDIDERLKGGWGHNDGTRFVEAEQGIAPYDGEKMLKFITTGYPGDDFSSGGAGWQGGIYSGASSDVVQLIDVQGSTAIAEGNAIFSATVRVNRVAAGDDGLFKLSLWTFAGPLSDLADERNTPDWSRLNYAGLYSDSYPGTWEELTLTITPPADTTFIRLGISALENKATKSSAYPELSGHYADAVSVRLFTPPHGH